MTADLYSPLADRLAAVLLSPGSLLSVWSLLGALGIAVAVALAKRRGRAVSLTALARAMFPRHRLLSASARADWGFTLLSIFGTGALFGWAVMSHLVIADAVVAQLGVVPLTGLPGWMVAAATTLALYVAYEFAYWFDHFLSHRWRWLWAFHKVHHSAETLSPLTVFRVHPVDSIVFYNIAAIVTGMMAGAMRLLFGEAASPLTVAGTNAIMVATILTVKHLHHSHVWISWGGVWGRLLLSPAHHQIHHSVAPEHHDRNFGDTLAVFDWLAGTLYQPAARRQPLVFGVADYAEPHSATGALLAPFADALTPPSPPDAARASSFR